MRGRGDRDHWLETRGEEKERKGHLGTKQSPREYRFAPRPVSAAAAATLFGRLIPPPPPAHTQDRAQTYTFRIRISIIKRRKQTRAKFFNYRLSSQARLQSLFQRREEEACARRHHHVRVLRVIFEWPIRDARRIASHRSRSHCPIDDFTVICTESGRAASHPTNASRKINSDKISRRHKNK